MNDEYEHNLINKLLYVKDGKIKQQNCVPKSYMFPPIHCNNSFNGCTAQCLLSPKEKWRCWCWDYPEEGGYVQGHPLGYNVMHGYWHLSLNRRRIQIMKFK